MIPIAALLRVAAAKVTSAANAIKTAVKTTVKDIGAGIKNTIGKTAGAKSVKDSSAGKQTANVPRETFESNTQSSKVPPETFDDLISESGDNETFRFLLNNAGDPSLSPYDASDVSLFFRLTKYIWDKPGIDLDKRLDAIEQYFNKPLYDIFDYVIKSDEAMDYLEDFFFGDVEYEKYLFMPFESSGKQLFTNQV